MNKNINLLGKLLKRKELQEEQVRIKTKKRRAQKKFAQVTIKKQRKLNK